MSNDWRPIDETFVIAVARIIGPQSAAAQALVELERRRADGEDVVLFRTRQAIVVGPPLPSPPEEE